MKRTILSLVFSLLLLPAFSQSLSLSNADGPVADGSTITLWGEVSNFIVAYMYVTNNATSDLDVICVREEISLVTGSINYFCWDQCFDPAVDTSGILPLAAGATNSNNFSGDYTASGNPGTSTVKYTFYDAGNPTDRVSFTVNFYGSPASIGDNTLPRLTVSKAYPNPAADVFAFDYIVPADVKPVRIIIRDILGGVVRDIDVNPGEGTLSVRTEGMKEGIYFYSIMVGNEVSSTRKLVIK